MPTKPKTKSEPETLTTLSPAELRRIGDDLGLTADALAKVIGVSGGRTIRKWESGERSIPGPVALVMRALSECPEFRAFAGLPGRE